MATEIQNVLQFWFKDSGADSLKNCMQRWFEPDPKFDQEIKSNFFDTLDQALNGNLDQWQETIDGSLALILVCDQFTRNIHRGAAASYSGDRKALAISKNLIALGHDKNMPLLQRLFVYLPFMHAEDKATQAQSLELYTTLAQDAPSSVKKYFKESLEYAKKHKAIIDQFGRFLHRNKDLGRPDTAAEKIFLKEKGRGF